MRQVGWYDPQSCSFFNGDKDDGAHAMYSEPVYVDETPAMPPVKVPKDDDDPFNEKLWCEIQLQILENQCVVLLAMLKFPELVGLGLDERVVNQRKHTISLLEKGRKSL